MFLTYIPTVTSPARFQDFTVVRFVEWHTCSQAPKTTCIQSMKAAEGFMPRKLSNLYMHSKMGLRLLAPEK